MCITCVLHVYYMCITCVLHVHYMCIVFVFQSMATFASTYVLVALTLDRLDAIARPMKFSSSGKKTAIIFWTFIFHTRGLHKKNIITK